MAFALEHFPNFPYPPSGMQEVEEVERYLTSLYRSMQEYFSTFPRDIYDGISVVELDDLAKTSLADPDADLIVFWDDSDTQYEFLTLGSTLSITTNTLNWSHLGLESLTDPGGDRIFFWDDGETASKWLAPDGTSIEISGTTLQVAADGINDTHIDWGTGANQVSAVDMPIADEAGYYTGTNVETALQEAAASDLLFPPVEDWHDPTGGLPEDPEVGDRYISEATAGGWTADYIYEWNGEEWIEFAPEEGWMVWMILEFMFYFFFSGGWVETDKRVGVDSDSTPGYLGAAYNDGVLRVDQNELTYTDGGDYVTIGLANSDTARAALGLGTSDSPTLTDLTLSSPLNIYALSHDSFADFSASEHFLQTAITNVSTALSTGLLKVTTGTGALSIIADASANWNTAYGWGDHASGGYAAASHAMSTHSDEDTYNILTSGTLGAGNATLGTVNALTLTSAATGFTIAGGSTSKTLTMNDTFNVSTQLTAIGANTTHRGSVGTDHGYIDQDLQTTTSPTFVTVKLSGLTDAYIPYHVNDATGLANSSIHINGINVAIGGASPTEKLEVSDGNLRMKLKTTVNDNVCGLEMNAKDADGHDRYGGLYWKGEDTNDTSFFSISADHTNYQLIIVGAGNMGFWQSTFGDNATKVFAIQTGVAPTTAPANCFQQYSADIQAGEAAPHFMTEHGDVIKLYQQAHIADAPGDTTANNATTINAILVALENAGLLATE